MLEGKVMKLRSHKAREVYITILEANKYDTAAGQKTFVKYHQKDLDWNTEAVLEDSLQYVQENYYEVDIWPEEV